MPVLVGLLQFNAADYTVDTAVINQMKNGARYSKNTGKGGGGEMASNKRRRFEMTHRRRYVSASIQYLFSPFSSILFGWTWLLGGRLNGKSSIDKFHWHVRREILTMEWNSFEIKWIACWFKWISISMSSSIHSNWKECDFWMFSAIL